MGKNFCPRNTGKTQNQNYYYRELNIFCTFAVNLNQRDHKLSEVT
jgi:hypothetical protein